MRATPLIKGMFINSHVWALRSAKGEEGVAELRRRLGRPISFNNLKDYPVREEVELIEVVHELLYGPSPEETRSFEAGRLHFKNFITTPFGKILMSALPKTSDGFRRLLLSVRHIVKHIFKNTNFASEAKETNKLRIVMENSDYPIDHFRGLFYEWQLYWNLDSPQVKAQELSPGRFEYILSWSN